MTLSLALASPFCQFLLELLTAQFFFSASGDSYGLYDLPKLAIPQKGPVAQNRDYRTEQSGIGVWGSSCSEIGVDGTKSAQNEKRAGEQVISIM